MTAQPQEPPPGSFTGSDAELPELLTDLYVHDGDGNPNFAADDPEVIADLKQWRDAAVAAERDRGLAVLEGKLSSDERDYDEALATYQNAGDAHGSARAAAKLTAVRWALKYLSYPEVTGPGRTT